MPPNTASPSKPQLTGSLIAIPQAITMLMKGLASYCYRPTYACVLLNASQLSFRERTANPRRAKQQLQEHEFLVFGRCGSVILRACKPGTSYGEGLPPHREEVSREDRRSRPVVITSRSLSDHTGDITWARL